MRSFIPLLLAAAVFAACRSRSSSSTPTEAQPLPDAERLAFDVNDLSILFPLVGTLPYPRLAPPWSGPQVFERMIAFARGSELEGRRVGSFTRDGVERNDPDAAQPLPDDGVHEFVRDQRRWRIVSLRVDPCAHAEDDRCDVELRLIAQPFDDGDFDIDTSAHLLFRLGKLDEVTATLRDLVRDVQQIKALTMASGTTTDGVPLGPHPGLVREGATHAGGEPGPIAQAVLRLVERYTAGGLTTVTSMQTGDTTPWLFFQGNVAGGVWRPVPITGANAQFSIRKLPVLGTSRGKVLPEPLTRPSTAPRFNRNEIVPRTDFLLENPGRYGEHGAKLSVANTDCVSCHTTGDFGAQGLTVRAADHLDALYVPEDGITGYRGDGVLDAATKQWSFRAFGYFDAEPAVVARTVNEAAEAARFANRRVLPAVYGRTFDHPGLKCAGAPGRTRPQVHAAMVDCVRAATAFAACKQRVCGSRR